LSRWIREMELIACQGCSGIIQLNDLAEHDTLSIYAHSNTV